LIICRDYLLHRRALMTASLIDATIFLWCAEFFTRVARATAYI